MSFWPINFLDFYDPILCDAGAWPVFQRDSEEGDEVSEDDGAGASRVRQGACDHQGDRTTAGQEQVHLGTILLV